MPEKSVIAEKRVYNMTPEVKERIDQIRHGIVPEGYKKTKAGIVPAEWTEYAIADCLKRVERPVEVKSDEMYTQIGIRSHGKGLFYKEPVNGKALGNKSVFWIEPDCFVLNIVFAWEQAIGKTTQKEVGMIGSHRFPMYQPISERVDIDYLISYLMTKRGKNILEAASPGGAGRNRTLGQDRFMNSKIVLPTLAEQKKIALILTMQDKIIELEQQKIEEIKKVKRFFLEKMFQKEGQTVPEIRFKGFTAPWEKRKFSDITFPAGEKNKDNLPLESYSITNEYGFVPQDEKFENGGTMREADKRMYYIVSPNSFAYNPARINVGSIGYQNVGKNVIVSSLYEVFKASEDVDDRLLWHWFKSPDFQKLIMQLQEGGVRLYFYYDKLCMGEVFLPSLEEQRKIGKLFDTIDHLITLHQRKLEEEKRKKKALMQLLLTGLVRVNA